MAIVLLPCRLLTVVSLSDGAEPPPVLDSWLDAAQHLIQRVGQTATTAKEHLPELKSPPWSHAIADHTQLAVRSSLSEWLSEHPILAWMSSHPIWALVAVWFSVLLLGGLLRALSRLIEHIGLAILKAPLRLLGWLLLLPWRWWRRPVAPTPSEPPTAQERLAALLLRLDAVRQEQDAILREIQALLGATAKQPPALPPARSSPLSTRQP